MASFGDSRGQRQQDKSTPLSAQAYHSALKDGRSCLRPLSFPATRSALWDPRPTGPSQTLHIANTRSPVLILEEKTIRLAHRFAEQNAEDSYICTLSGSLNVSPDGDGVSITVDEFDTCRPPSPSEALPGNVFVPCKVQKKSAKPSSSVEDYSECIKSLYERCGSSQRVDMAQLVAVRAYCSYHGNHQSFIFHLTFDLLTPATVFRVAPVAAVPIAPTALSKNLAGPMSVTEVQGHAKSGYLTMDETRKLLLILESDPKVANLPLIGIWVSGITNVHDPFVWASCLRYLHNSNLKDRVCVPPEQFLVVLFSPLQARPLFFQANTANGRTQPDFSLHTCHEVIQLPKDCAGGGYHGRSGSPMELEMHKVDSGDKLTVLQAAMESCQSLLSSPVPISPLRPNIPVDDQDYTPRQFIVPTPHVAKDASIIKPCGLDVSVLLDDPPPPPINGATIPTSIPMSVQQQQQHYHPPQPAPALTAPVATKVKKKKKDGSVKKPVPQMYMPPQQLYMQGPQMMQQYPQMPAGFYHPNAPNAPYVSAPYGQPFHPATSQAFPAPQQFHPAQYEQMPPQSQHYPHPQPQAPAKKKTIKKSSSKSSLNAQDMKQQMNVHLASSSSAPQLLQAPSTPATQIRHHVATPAPTPTSHHGPTPISCQPPTTPISHQALTAHTPVSYQRPTTPISHQGPMPHAPSSYQGSMAATPISQQAPYVSSSPMLAAHLLNQSAALTTSVPGSPHVPGAHDSADSGLHDSSGEPQDDHHMSPTTTSTTNTPNTHAIPPHYLETMRQQQQQIAHLMQQVSLLQRQQQAATAPTTTTTTTTSKQHQDSATQSSDPSSPVKTKNSVAINTTMWFPPPPIRESPPERQRDATSPQQQQQQECSSMSFNDYPHMNTSQQDISASIVSDIIVDMPEYTSMSSDRCNLTTDPQSPVFESASMCAGHNVSEQYTREYVDSQQQYQDAGYHDGSGGYQDEQGDYDHTSTDSDHSVDAEETNPLTMNYDNIMVAVQKMLQRDDQNGSCCTPHATPHATPQDSLCSSSSHHMSPYVSVQEQHAEAARHQVDVAERTRQQIAAYTGLVGSDSSGSSADTTRYEQSCFIDPAMVQRIEYQSMMLEKEYSIDPTDTLAMKYLSDDMLSQLARARLASPHKAGGVDTLLSAASTPPTPNKHFSIASRDYMRRYGLLDYDEDSSPSKHTSAAASEANGYCSDGQFHSSTATDSAHAHHRNNNVRRSLDASLSQTQKHGRVLDIEELKELPKLF